MKNRATAQASLSTIYQLKGNGRSTKWGNEKRSRNSIKLRMKGRVRKKQKKRDGKGRKQDKRGTKRGGTAWN